MKKQLFGTVIIIVILSISANAQVTNSWKGGFPGRENDWNCQQNWSLGKSPDIFDNVVIPDVSTASRRYPIIDSGEVEVASIQIRPGASLTLIAGARLLAEEIQVLGTCKGCQRRVVVVNGVEATAAAHEREARVQVRPAVDFPD
ncbi:MAG TPA: hypothetical protein PK971_09750 [Saprospiraceae bacterium]|nr:hypothetical protein [Saprospiraceae bacterium]